ncbi:hypothetical protein [Breoghania sp. L-A4]|uniref:hypothetical protein n=1 Tax=Breoghania sp. L-A4 TaxID=2304600 RepID=UPI000E35A675|nr:hypothetical protein [Breoghania sp. L-A4]AXS38979.1 hypothetical protein D1F64_01490 [Breoghania sp. L-A4]
MTDAAPTGLTILIRNPLLRLLAINWLIGFCVTTLVVSGLLYWDAGGLWSLIARAEAPLVPLAMLFFGFLITLCSAAMGTAIMAMPSKDAETPPGRPKKLWANAHTVPAVAESVSRRSAAR